MTRKRDTPPEVLLQRVITELERDDRVNHPSHRAAVLALLSEGPLMCTEAFLRELEQPNPEVSLWRAELLAYVRTLVRERGRISYGTLSTYTGTNYSSQLGPTGDVALFADSRDVRTVVVQQFVLLLLMVGLRNIRRCGRADCPHLYVKTYRREFCSVRCQQTDFKRRRRAEARERKARHTAARLRRKLSPLK